MILRDQRAPLLVCKLSVLTNLPYPNVDPLEISPASFGGLVYYTSPDEANYSLKYKTKRSKKFVLPTQRLIDIKTSPKKSQQPSPCLALFSFAFAALYLEEAKKRRLDRPKVAIWVFIDKPLRRAQSHQPNSDFTKNFSKSHAVVQGLQIAWNKQDIPALQEGIRANRALLNDLLEMQLKNQTPTPANTLHAVSLVPARKHLALAVATAVFATQNETQRQQIETQWAQAPNSSASVTIAEAW